MKEYKGVKVIIGDNAKPHITENDVKLFIDSHLLDLATKKKQYKYEYGNVLEEELIRVIFNLNGEWLEGKPVYRRQPFDRIRRITGYLVGTTDRFNDAKKQEEKDRVKHLL